MNNKRIAVVFFFMITIIACNKEQKNNKTNILIHNMKQSIAKVQHFNFEEMEYESIGEGIQRKWFHGDLGQMTIFNLEKGAHIPWHKHPNEQITYIMSGKVKVKTIIDNQEQFVEVSAGEVIVLPENVPHEFWALENTVDLDVHVPVRQDWLSKELPDYLKKSK